VVAAGLVVQLIRVGHPTADERMPVPEAVWRGIVARAKPEPSDPLVRERDEMAEFARGRLRWFQGHTAGVLLRFVAEDSPEAASRLCCVRAVPGQGKSALLAKLAQHLVENRPNDLVIPHFVGATENSADLRPMLLRLTEELRPFAGPQPQTAEQSPAEGGAALSEEGQDLTLELWR
jgi:hypothetical protein